MLDLSSILVGLAALAALGLVLFAHDWRDELRERKQQRPQSQAREEHHPLRDWWLRHRH